VFATHVVPLVLGLRVEGAGAWEGPHPLGPVLAVLAVAATAAAAVVLARRRPEARILVVALVLFPFVYAAFSTSWQWNDGRYGVYLTPLLALVWMGALWEVARRWAGWLASGLVLAAVASTLFAFNAGYGALSSPGQLLRWHANPNPVVTGLSHRLEASGVHAVIAQYWVANNLNFNSDGAVVGIDPDSVRNPPGSGSDLGEAERTWVFVDPAGLRVAAGALGVASGLDPGGVTPAELTRWSAAHGVPHRVARVGPFVVVRLGRAVSPAEVG
jgi:hypothetical protein